MTRPALCQGDGRFTSRCHCRQCARILPHRAEGITQCQCGAEVSPPGTVSLCREGLTALTEEEWQEHLAARRLLDSRREGKLF